MPQTRPNTPPSGHSKHELDALTPRAKARGPPRYLLPIGQPMQSLMPMQSHELFAAALQQARCGEHPEPYDTVWCRADGTLVDVTVNVCALSATSGQVTGYSAIARDITAQV